MNVAEFVRIPKFHNFGYEKDDIMANTNGQAYGLTLLSPIKKNPNRRPSHEAEIREILSRLGTGADSPLAKVPTTHMARIVVIDDVFFQGHPAHEDHLKSKYLLFTSNFDGPLDAYLDLLGTEIPHVVNAIWSHCVNFPGAGVGNNQPFREYMKRCQLTTTFFFADYPDATVAQVLRALDTQRKFIEFMERTQGIPAAELQREFKQFMSALRTAPTPKPGTI